ncbi:MAG: hypothetical protein KIH63_005320 [Candidatus Saccharibacteria bacterium]|nr:hypothetical protein [Candidatus Saccharibacteria bacterium]
MTNMPRRAEPPDLLGGPLSPENHAWLLTQQIRGHREGSSHQRNFAAIADQCGYVLDERGAYIPGPDSYALREEIQFDQVAPGDTTQYFDVFPPDIT